MQQDFHFYVTGMLAKHAGYTDDESITIATAAQYVDHATESFPIHFEDGRIFETTMTAHYHIRSFEEGVQKKVFMCFHFPPHGLTTEGERKFFSFKTKENSPIINDLLYQIKADTVQGTYDYLDRNTTFPFHLYRLGVAIHTLADSWSHKSFTGRHNDENDVGKIWFKKGSKWKRQYYNDWKWDVAPTIGHAECGHYPDQPFRCMQYNLPSSEGKKMKKITRTNPVQFKEAAKKCLEWLNKFNTDTSDSNLWDDDSPAMKCLDFLIKLEEEDSKKRIQALKENEVFTKHYSSLFAGSSDYNSNKWRDEAIIPRELNDPWGERKRRKQLHAKPKPGFEGSNFRLFHKAAKLQRTFILDKLFW